MPRIVKSSITLTADLVQHLGTLRGTAADVSAETISQLIGGSKRKAIFAIHGISPMQRYAFQDEVAMSLQSCLNAVEELKKTAHSWKSVVYWPFVGGETNQTLRPSALRIYRDDDNPQQPQGTVYDVYEGYWSPLSKGKTNISSVVQWLLRSIFLPASSTANVPCTPAKLKADLGYIGAVLLMVAVALVIALATGFSAWAKLQLLVPGASQLGLWDVLSNPLSAVFKLPPLGYIEFAVDLIAVYLLWQLVASYLGESARRKRAKELRLDAHAGGWFDRQCISAAAFHKSMERILWLAFGVFAALAVSVPLIYNHNWYKATEYAFYSLLVVIAVGSLQVARIFANFAVEDVLGDIQLYTTHDQNSEYFAIRQRIIQTVGDALTGILRSIEEPDPTIKRDAQTPPPEPYYEAIHIFGHSLGSTIGIDVLIRLRQMVQEGLLRPDQWGRIRSFTTFGTSLEKTRYFFDVRQPTINAAQDQWANDVYGRFFTLASSTLTQPDNRQGIYWSNLWYFRDIVANEIVSYVSEVPVGDSFVWTATSHEICENFQLVNDRPRFAWVHSDYLGDKVFWQRVVPVIA